MNGATPPGAVLVPGTRVRVRFDWPESRGPAHVRTPHYLRGREGVVLAHLGDFPDPSELAFGRPFNCRRGAASCRGLGIYAAGALAAV